VSGRFGLALVGALAVGTWGGRADAFERQWHVGLSAGYAMGGFSPQLAHGFAAGLHGTYGLTDAFNLRLHSDVSAFELPATDASAVVFNAAFGAEYVFDILRWVPYVGATVGPSTLFRPSESTIVHLGFEVPLGLGYQLSRNWTIGGEVRYRLLLLGPSDVSPMNNFLGLGRAEYSWGS
jgi:hypothetical protein